LLLTLIRVDEDHVRTADLNQPLIVVKIRELGGDPLIIDGYGWGFGPSSVQTRDGGRPRSGRVALVRPR